MTRERYKPHPAIIDPMGRELRVLDTACVEAKRKIREAAGWLDCLPQEMLDRHGVQYTFRLIQTNLAQVDTALDTLATRIKTYNNK